MLNPRTNPPDLKLFAKEAFEALGGVIQDGNALEILIPDEWVPHFGGRDTLQLQFQPGSSPSASAEEIFTLGTPVCEDLVCLLAKKGDLSKAYLNPIFKIGNLEEKFLKNIQWVRAKPYLKNQSVEETASAIFSFKVTFLTDDKTESLYPLAVNLATLCPHDRLIKEWENLFIESQPSYQGIPCFPLPALEDAYEKASGMLVQSISSELKKAKALQEKFLRRDLASIEEYYTSLRLELEEKRKKCRAEEEVLKRIQDRKMVLELDRRKKIADIHDKYRIEVKAEPVNLLVIYQPWVRMVWGLRTHEGELERIFYWDPVLKDFFNTFCEECRKECKTFFIDDRKLVCQICRKKA